MSSLVLAYLNELPSLDQLYSNPWTCQAVFRSLPPLARQYILRLLYVGNREIPLHLIKKWVNVADPEVKKRHEAAIASMESLKLFTREKKQVELRRNRYSMRQYIRLNPIFQEQMKISISNSKASPWETVDLTKDKNPPDLEKLQTHSKRQWGSVLEKLFGGTKDVASYKGVVDLLEKTGLMEDNGTNLLISRAGYQFLFRDPFEQIWTLLQAYLEQQSEHRAELLTFLFQLSFLTVGKDYAIAALTESQKSFVKILAEFGLIYKNKSGSRRYYPTHLAVNLISGRETMQKEGYIVAETNNQIYAYCKSTLKIKVLNLFMDMKFRLPGLVIGKLTRSSLGLAFGNGITANQIIHFLRQNTHPEAQRLQYPIPETLIHQIQLWEQEKNAVQHQEGVLYDRFTTHAEYEERKNQAAELHILLWSNDTTKMFFIREGGEALLTQRKKIIAAIADFQRSFEAQEWTTAIEHFNMASNLDQEDLLFTPQNHPILHKLVVALFQARHFEGTVKICSIILENDLTVKDFDVLLARGEALLNMGQLEQAICDFSTAKKLNPNDHRPVTALQRIQALLQQQAAQ